MTIRIIEDQSDITLTRFEYERLHREWQASQQMTMHPQDFESWVRSKTRVSSNFLPCLDMQGVMQSMEGLSTGKASVELYRRIQDSK